jgi:hypothetical protein
VFGVEPMAARHFVVLPLILLTVASLTGTLVRRTVGTATRGAFLFGAAASLFLAPVPLYAGGPYFTNWASGLIFGINQYGLVVVPVLMGLCLIARPGAAGDSIAGRLVIAAIVASLIPSHALIAALAVGGLVPVIAVAAGARALGRMRSQTQWAEAMPSMLALIGVVSAATIAWGLVTGHGFGASIVSPSVSPFNDAWRETMIRTALGASLLVVGPVGWLVLGRPRASWVMALLATAIAISAGAVIWGARLGDFNMFHAFFGALVVFGTPVAAASIWGLWRAARRGHRRLTAAAIFVACGVQLGIGAFVGLARLELFSPPAHPPVPLSILREIERLPPDAKLAYSCSPLEEVSFWEGTLIGIDAHTGRRIVPMCFQAEIYTQLLTGGENAPDVPNPVFTEAPQRILYPHSQARPSADAVEAFLVSNGIEFIYSDPEHPNDLIPDAEQIASERGVELLRIP